jgi:MGT family glycosyltransferase
VVEIIAQAASQMARLVTASTRRKANVLRRSYGLPPLTTGVNEFTGTMPLYLVPSSPEFDNQRRDLPPSVRYVGPCLWDKSPDEPAPAWVGEVPRDRPVVLVEEGSLYTHEPRVLRMAAEALAGQPLSVQVVAGCGRQMDALNLGTLAGNVAVRPYTPLSDLLPLASVLVTNGNSESVLAALQAGVPTVVLPSIWDQAELAWRVHETGVGIRLSPWRSKARDLRTAVEQVLGDPAFRERTATVAATLARCGGPVVAARYVEEGVSGARAKPHGLAC